MNRQLVTAFSLSTLLLACAHNRSNDPGAEGSVDAHASAETREARAEDRAEDNRENAEERADNAGDRAEDRADRAEDRADGVAVPKKREKRDEIASSGDELPSDRQPDNTGINERDKGGAGLTPMDQGNSEIDIDTTKRIRKAVMGSDVSFTAKNVKIITRDGHVVLRGPVNSQAEKDTIFKLATSNAGGGRVTNQLEVKSD